MGVVFTSNWLRTAMNHSTLGVMDRLFSKTSVPSNLHCRTRVYSRNQNSKPLLDPPKTPSLLYAFQNFFLGKMRHCPGNLGHEILSEKFGRLYHITYNNATWY